jgi:DNA polymerase III delta subunit
MKETMDLGRALISQDTSMINLLYPLTEFFQELLFIKISKGTIGYKKGYSSLSPSVNKQLPGYAKQYTSKEITLALKRLAHIDQQLKTSRIKDESAITEFVYSTLRNG